MCSGCCVTVLTAEMKVICELTKMQISDSPFKDKWPAGVLRVKDFMSLGPYEFGDQGISDIITALAKNFFIYC